VALSTDCKGKLMLRIDPASHQRLTLKAVTTGESLNQIVARTLAKA
jgi:predicted HicB family RNase H-like nuclease